jgi:adenosine deaminase
MRLAPHRVQHGIRAFEDPVLFKVLAAAGIGLDVAPTSNVSLGVVPDLEHFPVRAMLDAGLRFSVNADGLQTFRKTATLELHRLARVHHLSRPEIATIAESAFVIVPRNAIW